MSTGCGTALVILVALLSFSCAAPFDSYRVAQDLAPGHLRCEQVTQGTTQNDANLVYAFEGCGRYVIYDCVWSSGQGSRCRVVAHGEGQAWKNSEH